MEKKTNGKLLQEILQRITRLEVLLEEDSKRHVEFMDALKELSKTCNDLAHKNEERIIKLEKESVRLSTVWKVIVFLWGAVPTIILILKTFGVI